MCWFTQKEEEAIEDTYRERDDAHWKPISYIRNITMYKCDRCRNYAICVKEGRRDLGDNHVVPDVIITAKEHGVCSVCQKAIVRKQSKITYHERLQKWIHTTCKQFVEG
jgi:hypothetical protein